MAAQSIQDIGIVLRTIKLGEADRIVSILTLNHGKIRGVAKGARKSGSKYSARLESASVVDFQWIPSNRDLVRITQTDSVHPNRHIREDLDLLNSAARILDTVDGLCEDHSSHNDLALMTMNALSTMNETRSSKVCSIFLFKVLRLEGFAPQIDQCPGCGGEENLRHFSMNNSSFFCDDCAPVSTIETYAHTREAMLAISDGKTGAVLDNIPSEIAHELESLSIALIEHHTGRTLRAVTIV